MKPDRIINRETPLDLAADYGRTFRQKVRPLHPTATVDELRAAFCQPLNDAGQAPEAALQDLIAAAEPGLVGNTDPDFFAWVMGGSSPVGVAADWLTSVWGQNAAIYQTAPAAAVAEEAVSAWLLDLLDLPRESSVGFVTGATMATFVSLAAARNTVLERAGHDFKKDGLQVAPKIHVFFSDDLHVVNISALRQLGLGDRNFHPLPSDDAGRMNIMALEAAMRSVAGPKIIIAQAGHINSGGFEDMEAIAALARQHDAWVHVDGAFGLWARTLPEKSDLTRGLGLADSWSVDGHKWLQLPYESGFAIVRDADAHRRAMSVTAGYLNQSPEDGRNPSEYNPELSKRARGFAAWAVFRALGRDGVRQIVRRHCDAARLVAEGVPDIEGLFVQNDVSLNQLVIEAKGDDGTLIRELAERLNNTGVFVRTADWKGRTVLRLSLISDTTEATAARRLLAAIRTCWAEIFVKPPAQ